MKTFMQQGHANILGEMVTTGLGQKLHQQFGHPTSKRLKLLLTDGGIQDKEFLDMVEIISAECDVCKKYKKTPSRPVVCIPLARDFNECVAMDLKEWKKGQIYFLHLIDVATRFSQAAVVYTKDRHTIINKVIQLWIGTGL